MNVRELYDDLRGYEGSRSAPLAPSYRGKVRDLFIEENEVQMFHTDRLSAFDCAVGLVPGKGCILATLSAWWLSRSPIENHLLEQVSPRVLRVKKLQPIRCEVIVRDFLAGSLARAYAAGRRQFCGVTLKNGLKEFDRLDTCLITPTTKEEFGQHDQEISPQGLIEKGICTDREWQYLDAASRQLFVFARGVAKERGWIIADTKYEFGRTEDGALVLIDEIHTPDSSRFWRASSYREGAVPEMLDKEIVRRWLMARGFSGSGDVPKVPMDVLLGLGRIYLDVAESFTGMPVPFEP